MSLITVVVTKNIISFVSDGRLTNKSGVVVKEDHKKFAKLSNDLIIGITGNFNEASKIIHNSKELYYKTNCDIDEFVKTLSKWVKREMLQVENPNINVQVAVSGRTTEGKLTVSCFNNHLNNLIQSRTLTSPDDISYLVLGHIEAIKHLQSKLSGKSSIEEIITAQKKANYEVSLLDDSVNDLTFNEYIHL